MKSRITLIRAISGEFILRKYRSLVTVLAVIAVISLGLGIWLSTMSAWWWLLLAPMIIVTVIVSALIIVVRVLINVVRPDITRERQVAVSDFVDKLERVSEHIQTPMFMIVFQLAYDVIRPRTPTFVETVARDSTTLHSDLAELQRLFENS